MKLVFESIIFSLQRAGGISVYWFELLKRINQKNENFKVYGQLNNNIFCEQLTSLSTEKESSILPAEVLRYLPFTRCLPKPTIFHSSYYRVSLQRQVANITTVHDFTYEYYVSGIKEKIHSWQKGFALARSAGIICVSENTKKDLLKFYPKTDPKKISVIYNGVGDEFFPLNKDFIRPVLFDELNEQRFILFIGDRSPYKNFGKAIEVVTRFSDMALVVVGGKPFSTEEEEQLKLLNGRVFEYKGLSGEGLNWLYNNAFCLLYPSSYEGFGIPILEAMKAGCPVVSTNLSSIPEVAGDAGLLVNEVTTEALSSKVESLFNETYRAEVIELGYTRASLFSWDKCFEEMMQFYKFVWDREFG